MAFDFPAKMLQSVAGEYSDPNWQGFNPKGSKEKAWAKTVSFTEPIKVTVFADGLVGFSDGHHRAMAGKILGIAIPVTIQRNSLSSGVWKLVLDLYQHGCTYRDINPEGYNLRTSGQVPSLDAVKAGRKTGLSDWKLTEFYEQFGKPSPARVAGRATPRNGLHALGRASVPAVPVQQPR